MRSGPLEGVVAVALGGSLARGRGDANSDVDLGIYYDPAQPFSVEALRDLATESTPARCTTAWPCTTPTGVAAAVEAALRGLRPDPAVLEAALEAMAALTATVALLDRG